MKRLVLSLAILVLFLAPAITLAFECPTRIKEANDAIAKAEPALAKIADAKKKGEAQAFLTVAKNLTKEANDDHKNGAAKGDANLHYLSAAKAKLARMAAEQASK